MKFPGLLTLSALAFAATSPAQSFTDRPRLVVVISIDQFRADYVNRFASHYLPAKSGGKLGGFRFLAEQGAYFPDAHYSHIPTATGPGHATILTGSIPALHGIVDNDWYDRETKKVVYCVDDAKSQTVGGPSNPMSPRNLLVTTVGDELKMATNGKAKVVGVSFKDRAAILLSGHAADTVIWFDTLNGAWVTSDFYRSTLPAWVQKVNAEKRPDAEVGQVWTPLLPTSEYQFARKPPFEQNSPDAVFSHKTDGAGKSKYRAWTTSAFGQQYVFDTVKTALTEEKLGQDDVPDLLAVNLATNDYVGHAYGPNSPEVEDISIRTDRMLSDLFNTLDKQVPGGMKSVTVVVTADHGVLPIVEESNNPYRLPATRIPDGAVEKAVNAALVAQYGSGAWVESVQGPHIYLNRTLIASKQLKMTEVGDAVVRALPSIPGVFGGYSALRVAEGEVADWPWTKLVTNNLNPRRSGDVFVLESPGSFFGDGTGTGHGSPWSYDNHVPILLGGFGIKRGINNETVHVADIASTLCRLLGIELPTGNVGHPLAKALKSE